MQAAESHCWCNFSASRNKNNGRNGGMAEWRNGGMAEWQKEWQNGQMAGMATYLLFMVHADTDDDDDDDDNNDTLIFYSIDGNGGNGVNGGNGGTAEWMAGRNTSDCHFSPPSHFFFVRIQLKWFLQKIRLRMSKETRQTAVSAPLLISLLCENEKKLCRQKICSRMAWRNTSDLFSVPPGKFLTVLDI